MNFIEQYQRFLDTSYIDMNVPFLEQQERACYCMIEETIHDREFHSRLCRLVVLLSSRREARQKADDHSFDRRYTNACVDLLEACQKYYCVVRKYWKERK